MDHDIDFGPAKTKEKTGKENTQEHFKTFIRSGRSTRPLPETLICIPVRYHYSSKAGVNESLYFECSDNIS